MSLTDAELKEVDMKLRECLGSGVGVTSLLTLLIGLNELLKESEPQPMPESVPLTEAERQTANDEVNAAFPVAVEETEPTSNPT